MGKKKLNPSKNDVAGAEPLETPQSAWESMSDIPDLTPEEWGWLKAQTSEFEKGYVPTRTLVPGV